MAIVKNASSGYGYKYNNLADLERAGVEIPKMRVKPTEFGEYVEYLDDNGGWQIGAKVVEMEMKGMNSAQAYGSSLTYARRYTVMLAKAVACDDDDAVEQNKPSTARQSSYATAPSDTGEKKWDKYRTGAKKEYTAQTCIEYLEGATTIAELQERWSKIGKWQGNEEVAASKEMLKEQLAK